MPARPSRLLLLLSVVGPIPEDEEGAVRTTDVLGVVVFSSADKVLVTSRRGSTVVGTGLDSAAVENNDREEDTDRGHHAEEDAVVVVSPCCCCRRCGRCCAPPSILSPRSFRG